MERSCSLDALCQVCRVGQIVDLMFVSSVIITGPIWLFYAGFFPIYIIEMINYDEFLTSQSAP